MALKGVLCFGVVGTLTSKAGWQNFSRFGARKSLTSSEGFPLLAIPQHFILNPWSAFSGAMDWIGIVISSFCCCRGCTCADSETPVRIASLLGGMVTFAHTDCFNQVEQDGMESSVCLDMPITFHMTSHWESSSPWIAKLFVISPGSIYHRSPSSVHGPARPLDSSPLTQGAHSSISACLVFLVGQ